MAWSPPAHQRQDRLGFSTRRLRHLQFQPNPGRHLLGASSSQHKSLQDLDAMYHPGIRAWINYYSHFYKTQLRPTLKRINLYVIRWARRKFKRLRRKTKGARDWFDRLL